MIAWFRNRLTPTVILIVLFTLLNTIAKWGGYLTAGVVVFNAFSAFITTPLAWQLGTRIGERVFGMKEEPSVSQLDPMPFEWFGCMCGTDAHYIRLWVDTEPDMHDTTIDVAFGWHWLPWRCRLSVIRDVLLGRASRHSYVLLTPGDAERLGTCLLGEAAKRRETHDQNQERARLGHQSRISERA